MKVILLFCWIITSFALVSASPTSHAENELKIGGPAGGARLPLPKNCKDLLDSGVVTSGVYTIYFDTPAEPRPLQVYCDMETDGGGWLVFQRRKDGSQNFFLGWEDYARGFGDIEGEFWFGNQYLHKLTIQRNELRVDLRDFDGVSKFAKYRTFQVDAESKKFKLTVEGFSGDAGDSLLLHNGMKFSTLDQDNDIDGTSCAELYKGAWWYKKCHVSNLNGLYLRGQHASFADGVEWHSFRGYNYSLQFTEMKIRPL
jgi:ficolin